MATDQALLEDPRPVPPANDWERYRQAVFAAGKGEEVTDLESILSGANRFTVDFEADVRTFTRRLRAVEQLKTEVPALQEKAADLTRQAHAVAPEGPEDLQAKPLKDMRVGELWGILKRLENPQSPEWEHPLRREARDARQTVDLVRNEAKRTLSETCDPAVLEKINELRGAAQNVERMIDERREVIEAPAKIAALRKQAEALSREPNHQIDHPVGLQNVVGENMIFSAREQLARVRQQLRHFQSLLPQRDAALQANKKDAARIDALNQERAKLEGERFKPEAMRFTTA